ncbi:MAG: hypothetical protein AB1724_08400 [Thermodesulfobacteriota bacterium]
MMPWIMLLVLCAAISVTAYLLMRLTVNNYLAGRSSAGLLRRAIHAVLLVLIWPPVAASPWLLAISWPPARSLLESNGLFPFYLLACHAAAAYPAYRYLYRSRLMELMRAGAEPLSFWPGQVPAAASEIRRRTPIHINAVPDDGKSRLPRIEALVRETRLVDYLPVCGEIRVVLKGDVPAGTRIEDAYPVWLPAAVAAVGPLPPFPHLGEKTQCPEGIIRLDVECVRRPSGGMSSYYGYEGYFFSLLANLTDGIIFDARGEKAV